ncbi:hypothetical protein J6590_052359 [Homalodisca vitripennis]|nr:hypothetical protein J6590_052359 [Homalodisca vitripennis]
MTLRMWKQTCAAGPLLGRIAITAAAGYLQMEEQSLAEGGGRVFGRVRHEDEIRGLSFQAHGDTSSFVRSSDGSGVADMKLGADTTPDVVVGDKTSSQWTRLPGPLLVWRGISRAITPAFFTMKCGLVFR